MLRLLALLILLAAPTVLAQAPRTLAYQGVLEDGGAPVTTATDLTFRLFGAATGGGTIWSETQNVTPDAEGLFAVSLGSVTALPVISAPLWLEVTIGGTALGPRTALGTVPYALALHGLRVVPTSFPGGPPSILGGHPSNVAGFGAVVAGGGFDNGADVWPNLATGVYTVVGGGLGNTASGTHSTVGGGQNNIAGSQYSTVGGGQSNAANDFGATVGGGQGNTASGLYGTVGGGSTNTASGDRATVGGGSGNVASGNRATVPGGRFSRARGETSFAAGYYARALHDGTFVWSDNSRPSTDSLSSTGQHQFLVRAVGGVGIGTNAPRVQLHVETLDLGLGGGALLNEDLVVEATDAVVGLYSDPNGRWGSAVTLGEIDPSGDLTSKWAMVRETMSDGGSLYFTFKSGPDSENYGANFPKVRFDINGSVHGGTYSSSGADFAEWLPLHDASAQPAPGQLVGVTGGRVGLATGGAEQVMIVSSDPALVGNPAAEAGGVLVALVGQAEVIVAGAASPGDLLVASGRADGRARAVPLAHYDPVADGPVAGRVLTADGGRVVALVGVDEAAALRAVVVRQAERLDGQQAELDALRAQLGRQAADHAARLARLEALLEVAGSR